MPRRRKEAAARPRTVLIPPDERCWVESDAYDRSAFAVLVQYPHQGSWTIAFVTGKPGGEVAEALGHDRGEEHVSLYVPTTPNPTSGFFLMMPRASVRPLKMTVDAALKHIISMGVVAPDEPAAEVRNLPG